MLKELNITNFTVFAKADFQFASGLNVFVGENGTGKSHVLKLVYSMITTNNASIRKNQQKRPSDKNAALISHREKLINVFLAESFTSLIRIKEKSPSIGGASLSFENSSFNCSFIYKQKFVDASSTFALEVNFPEKWEITPTVFIPTRELLTIYPGFPSLYEARYLQFEETYYDTCLLLGEPLLKKPMTNLLSILEEAMGGKVELDRDIFYLVTSDQEKIEMPLVAEGLRKLAMLAQLIAVGALKKGSYLFWDEPEANLNPRLIKVIANVILQLAQAGIQIFIATHSLFLLRELEILQTIDNNSVPQRYFALKREKEGVEVEQGDNVDDLQTLILLEEELLQSDRYMDAN